MYILHVPVPIVISELARATFDGIAKTGVCSEHSTTMNIGGNKYFKIGTEVIYLMQSNLVGMR